METPAGAGGSGDEGKLRKLAMVEAALFMAGRPMSLKELSESVGMTRKPTIGLVRELALNYVARGSALEISLDEGKNTAGMRVRQEYLSHVRDLSTLTDISDGEKKTLAIVAFYQPVKQSEIIKIRGNRGYNQLRKLEGAGLVKAEPRGSTKILTTTRKFTEYFGNMNVDEIKKRLEGKREDENSREQTGAAGHEERQVAEPELEGKVPLEPNNDSGTEPELEPELEEEGAGEPELKVSGSDSSNEDTEPEDQAPRKRDDSHEQP